MAATNQPRHNYAYIVDVISFTRTQPLHSARCLAFIQQGSELEQVTNSEMRALSADCDERVLRLYAGPRRRKAPEAAIVIVAVDPFFTPVMPICDQLKPAPVERVEWVANVETSQLIITTGCT